MLGKHPAALDGAPDVPINRGRAVAINSVEEEMMERGRELGTKLLDKISTANLVRGSSWIETAKSTKLPPSYLFTLLGVLVFVFFFPLLLLG